MKIKKSTLLLLFFLSLSNSLSANTNIEFNINKAACLFAQSFCIQGQQSPKILEFCNQINKLFLKDEDKNDKKNEFVNCLINNKVEHEYLTPEFSSILKEAKSEYDTIFEKKSDELLNRKDELSSYSETFFSKHQSFLTDIFKFYLILAQEDQNQKFRIYLYPSNDISSGKITVFGDNMFLKLVYNKQSEDLCSIIHEVCHKLYKFKKDTFENFFLKHKSKYSKAMLLLFDEFLATTIGNRLAYAKMNNGQEYKNDVSEDKYINTISRYFMPLIKKYINSSRWLDDQFLEESIKILEKDFKDINKTFDTMFLKINLIIEDKNLLPTYSKILKKEFCINDIYDNNKLPYTLIFIGENLGDPSLRSIGRKIPNKSGDFLSVILDENEKIYVIIKTKNEEKINKAVKILKDLKKVGPNGFECVL